jgi:glycerol-3-phosphate dehydrogenase
VVCNYVQAQGFLKDSKGKVTGLRTIDLESPDSRQSPEKQIDIQAKCVINATGPFCDELRRADEPTLEPIIAPSQGVHIVLEKSFLPGNAAVIVPKTSDGRVIFLIPWNNHTLIGTTDTSIPKPVSLRMYISGSRVGLLERKTVLAPCVRIASMVSAAPGRSSLPR